MNKAENIILDLAKERLSHPLIGTFILSFVVKNHPIFLNLLSTKDVDTKIILLKNYSFSYGWPLLFTVGYLFGLFILDVAMAIFNETKHAQVVLASNKTKAAFDLRDVSQRYDDMYQVFFSAHNESRDISVDVRGLKSDMKYVRDLLQRSEESVRQTGVMNYIQSVDNRIAQIDNRIIKILEDNKRVLK